MNVDELQARLMAAARALPPCEQAPYAFEKRVLAALKTRTSSDPWALWSLMLWRAAAPCVAVMLAVGVWTAITGPSTNAAENLAADLERTIWGPLNSIDQNW